MTKTYQSLTFMRLVITVQLQGEIGVECVFKGGKYFPYRENGTYRTNNKSIMEALESHERYGGDFVLVKTVEDTVEKKAEPKKVETPVEVPVKPPVVPTVPEDEPADKVEPPQNPEPAISADGTILVDEVKNSQDAKLYLNQHFKVPFSRLKNTEFIMKEAKIANITFPNWKI